MIISVKFRLIFISDLIINKLIFLGVFFFSCVYT